MEEQDPTTSPPAGLADLPVGATGSGVADLEIAFEQMRLAEGAADEAPPPTVRDAGLGSEAHPS